MRRFKQALPSSENIAILKQKTHGILALCDEKSFPYTVPLNYVYLNDKIYFHCANVGRKLDIIHQNNKASFCIINQDAVIPEKFTTAYSSVIVFGTIKEITTENDDFDIFKAALYEVLMNLTKMLAKDGEGAAEAMEEHMKRSKVRYNYR